MVAEAGVVGRGRVESEPQKTWICSRRVAKRATRRGEDEKIYATTVTGKICSLVSMDKK